MKIIIIFPKRFFSKEQLKDLEKYDTKFIEGKNIDLDKIEDLYKDEEFILSVDPTYLKNDWSALPIERIKKMKGLKALCLTTTSYSWIDTKKIAEMGITVTNIPGKSTEAVAEFNIFMMLFLLRKMPLIIKNDWKMDYDNFTNEELIGLNAGVLGLGKIGSKVADLCKGLGMNVSFWNRSRKDSQYSNLSLEEIFERSDVIFSTLATQPSLKGFINKDLISKLNKKAIIVSTSDIHIFDEEFISEQVAKGNLGGFAFENVSKKLTDYKGNVMVFPEQAYFTTGTLKNTTRILTETILSVIKGKPTNKVN